MAPKSVSGADMGKTKRRGRKGWSKSLECVCLTASIPTCSDRLLKFNALQSLAWACGFCLCLFSYVSSLTHMSVPRNEEIKAVVAV